MTQTTDFRNQYFQGKSCGLLTNKEASKLLGTPVATGGSVIASDSPAGQTHPGQPRIDSCAHSSLKSSDGYIDVVVIDYGNKKNALLYYDQEMAKTFPIESREPSALGEKLHYGGGVFYLLKNTLVIEVSASKTPRTVEPDPEAFSREVIETVVAKL